MTMHTENFADWEIYEREYKKRVSCEFRYLNYIIMRSLSTLPEEEEDEDERKREGEKGR